MPSPSLRTRLTSPRLVLLVLLSGAGGLACTPRSPPDSTPPSEVAVDEDERLPERPPIERSAELMAGGQHAAALAVLDEAIVASPTDPELHYARGIALEQLTRPQDAIAAWQAAVQLRPDFYPALNGIGAVQLDAGQTEAAIKSFEAAIAAKPDFSDAHYNLGRARLALGQQDQARAALEAANKLAPDDVDVLLLLTDLHRKAGRLDDAAATAKVAARRAPDDVDVRRTYGHVLMEQDQLAAAQIEFTAALTKKPDDIDAKLGLVRALVKQDRAEEALVPLADLAARVPDQAIVWSEWGAALAKLGRLDGPDGALAKLDRALQLKPDLASAHIRKIGALADSKQCKPARDAMKAFAARKPKPEAQSQAQTALARCK